MRGKAHSIDIRAAVIAALLAGDAVNEISRKMKLPKATVSRIRSEIAPAELEQVGTEKQRRMENLISNYLESNFGALRAICEVASDAGYLKRQPADAVAELHAELATRSFRLLEAESVEAAGGIEP